MVHRTMQVLVQQCKLLKAMSQKAENSVCHSVESPLEMNDILWALVVYKSITLSKRQIWRSTDLAIAMSTCVC